MPLLCCIWVSRSTNAASTKELLLYSRPYTAQGLSRHNVDVGHHHCRCLPCLHNLGIEPCKPPLRCFCYSVGQYSIDAYVVAGKFLAHKLCSYTMGLDAGVNFTVGWLTAFTTPYSNDANHRDWGTKFGTSGSLWLDRKCSCRSCSLKFAVAPRSRSTDAC